jgi:hypothetical protein
LRSPAAKPSYLTCGRRPCGSDQNIRLMHNDRGESDAECLCEAQPKGRPDGSAIEDYAVEDHADHVLATFKTQQEAIDWSRKNGHAPLVARVRHLNDKKKPDHWRAS